MKPKKVEVVFENCECFECQPCDIHIHISGAKSGQVRPHDTDLTTRLNVDYMRLDISFMEEDLIDRALQYDDITGVYITYPDDRVLVSEINTYQTATENFFGDLCVVIAKPSHPLLSEPAYNQEEEIARLSMLKEVEDAYNTAIQKRKAYESRFSTALIPTEKVMMELMGI